ncbi:MAG: ATPase [Algicola sp.]|nr:ATPase [Algicola sp.]
MMQQALEPAPLFLGIDGGGSKTRAIIYQQDKILGTGVSGPGNPYHGFEQSIDSVISATQKALIDAELSPNTISQLVAGVGLAGVNLPHLYDRVSNWQHPFKVMYLTTDLHIACLGSHQGQDGAVIITGTGSCGFSDSGDKPLVVGAHGFPHGDKGSGAWLGFSAVEHVLLAMDGLADATVLTEKVSEVLGCRNDLELVTAISGQKSGFFAKLARTVFDAVDEGDQVAINIVKDGAAYISELARKLWQTNPGRMSIIGGLSPRLMPWLDKEVAQRLSAPLAPPEMGAIFFAQEQMAANQKSAKMTAEA